MRFFPLNTKTYILAGDEGYNNPSLLVNRETPTFYVHFYLKNKTEFYVKSKRFFMKL